MKRHHNNWLEAYSEYSSCYPTFNKWAGLGIIASAIGNKTWLDMKYFVWHPNMFLLFVGAPSMNKTPIMREQITFLNRLENIEIRSSASLLMPLHELPNNSNIFVAFDQPIHFNSDELSTLVDTWNSTIPNISINMSICCTPTSFGILDSIIKSRALKILCEKREDIISPKGRDEDLYTSLLGDLIQISRMQGEYGLTKSAEDFVADWYNDYQTDRQGDPRMQIHIHKIAMVMAASESDDLIIHKSHMETAISYLGSLE